jgi:exonuclease SbcC
VSRGSALLNAEATLKNRLAAFRDRDRLATDLRTTILRIANEMKREDLQDLSFENILATLQTFVAAEISRLEALQSQRNRALLALQSVARIDQRRQAVTKEIADNSETVKVLKSALTTLDSLRGQAKTIGETARRARTAVVRRVFNDSLNKLWRDLFIRLAPTEPFVPAFHIPESDSDDIATLETVHRSGKTGGTPGAMLSAGNLNTAALTLFLALHFSVGTRLPWLVLDDPVQNMDEVHIAQFAALLRTLSKTHGTKLIISVHERPLFEYLRLELSPAFERDRLLTLELRRTQGEKTVVDPKINTYAVDAVAA